MSDTTVEELSAVRLSIPARARYLRLARLTAAGIGTDLGMDLQEIEDLRIAVDEACACLIQGCVDGGHDLDHAIDLHYEVHEDRLVIVGTAPCGGDAPVEVHPVARELLSMTTDEYEVAATAGGRRFRVVKRRSPAGA